jgi:transposase
VRSIGVIPNRCESVRKLVKKLGAVEELRFCYEAGPTGYVLYWQLTALDAKCEVVAPTLVPVRAGGRVKTDRRDALKLARSYRAGELTAVWVPDAAHEALRDLVRAREAAKRDQLRTRNRLSKVLVATWEKATRGSKSLDIELRELGEEGCAFRTASATSHLVRLPTRSRTHGCTSYASRAGHRGSSSVSAPPDA